MRRGFKNTIYILDFIRTGKFGIVELGLDYQSIMRNFSKPDDFMRMSQATYIWRYGAFEFHFIDGLLTLMWCDNLDFMYSPDKKQFKLDRWVIGKYEDGFLLPQFIEALHKENISFKMVGTYYSEKSLPDNVILEIENSTSEIYFEDIDENATNINEYKLIAIGSSSYGRSRTSRCLVDIKL